MAEQGNAPRPSLSTGVQIGQLATMIAGFAGMIFALGVKSEQINAQAADITQLASVVNDLAKAQASAAVADATHARALEDIQRRLAMLETRLK